MRCRPAMVRTMDVTHILGSMRQDNHFSEKDEELILHDSRRRERVIRFLDVLEKKKSEVYHSFLEVLGDLYPHLYLSLSDWEDESDLPVASAAHLDDDWSTLQRARPYLIKEIDAIKILPYLRSHGVITAKEETSIVREKDQYRRTEAFLDILELYPPGAYDTFVDACGEVYPHVYLALTGDGDNDYDDDDDLDNNAVY